MDYEKVYKKALERAKAVKETYLNLGNISAISVLESIFHELQHALRLCKIDKEIVL